MDNKGRGAFLMSDNSGWCVKGIANKCDNRGSRSYFHAEVVVGN